MSDATPAFPIRCAVWLFLAYTMAMHFYWAYSLPRYWRQREVISAVAQYSKLMSYESIENNKVFEKFVSISKSMSRPPFIIFYDTGNLDVFLNHICNLHLISKATSRLMAISFDQDAHSELQKEHPSIPSISVDFEYVKNAIPFDLKNRDYIIKQLILLYRTRVCALLASHGISFWMMQQDSIWLESFEALDLENRFPDKYLLFDVVGNNQLPEYTRMVGWICGSTFFVRGNPATYQFFRQVDEFTVSHQSPDSAIMTYLCGHENYKCQKLPRWVISSSNYFNGNRNETPVTVQVDTGVKGKTKMEMFREANLTFRLDDGKCDKSAMGRLQNAIRKALPSKIRKKNNYKESLFRKMRYLLKDIFNVDPFNNKVFLRVQHQLV